MTSVRLSACQAKRPEQALRPGQLDPLAFPEQPDPTQPHRAP
ncbi:MAG: hypothetical protein ACKN85_10725 [Pirellula sp.]